MSSLENSVPRLEDTINTLRERVARVRGIA